MCEFLFYYLFIWFLFCFFETEFHYVAQANPKFKLSVP
jgi:hypothetical protein